MRVLATCIGELEVTLHEECSPLTYQNALDEIAQTLQGEIIRSGDVVLASLHWIRSAEKCAALGHKRGLRAALLCDNFAACEQVGLTWSQPQLLCGGKASVVWISTMDTVSDTHCQRIAIAWQECQIGQTCVALELPIRWLLQPELFDMGQVSVPVPVGSVWFQFCEVFGELRSAERILLRGSQDLSKSVLLVHFKSLAGAQAMHEALMDRYLFLPWGDDLDDCCPATCSIHEYEEVRARLLQGCSMQESERAVPFKLRRCLGPRSSASSSSTIPEVFSVTIQQRRLVIGREQDCDIILRRPHVSKAHAVLSLQEASDSNGWILTLQDTSSNGTWVNGQKLQHGQTLRLRQSDQVSFLPPPEVTSSFGTTPELDDPLAYEVVELSSLAQRALPSGALPSEATNAEEQGCRSRSRSREEIPPQARRRLGADPQRGVDIREWLRSLGDPGLARYKDGLLSQYDSLSQIRSLYGDNISGFFEDVGIENMQHKATFRRALMRLRSGL